MPTRDMDWRQGNLLTCEAAATLGLIEASEANRCAIVITHDCDLVHEDEPFVEVIVGEVVEESDPRVSHCRNPRRLHLTWEGLDAAEPITLELRHANRRTVPKADFIAKARRDKIRALPDNEKRMLKQWLAARYGRAAFPNEFERRLRNKISSKKTVEKQIAKILEPEAKHLIGLFFDFGDQRNVEAADGEPYGLSVFVVYDAEEGARQARESAERVADELRSLFEQAYGPPDGATEIALDTCEAVADTEMTLADVRRFDQWRLEYISLRDGGQNDFLAAGEAPA
ncbi:MAG: hypothetical protein LBI92_08380 [Azoarcus sp.]|jgi:hypothetical protein|nr:hypothetical protein [Azoarcus sp.]